MRPRATVSPWKHSRFHAVHDGLELVAVCVYKKGALAVAELVDLANGHRINEPDPIDYGAAHCPACSAPLTDPDERFCESCAALDPADRHWIAAGNSIPAPAQPVNGLPTTGRACHCRPGTERDNCPNCEGTGRAIDWQRFHADKA